MKFARLLPLAMMTLLALAVPHSGFAGDSSGADPDADYDRLDGMGHSGEKVQVIEWEGNLEVHVYPAGSLKGLALKLDKRDKSKPVMVIGYRFVNDPKTQLIRRAILGITLADGFKTFKDPSESEFDKIIISNNTLSDSVVAFRLDPPPSQLYPDGSPALANGGGGTPDGSTRQPASSKVTAPAKDTAPDLDDDTGTIRPFYMDRGSKGR